MSGEGWIYTYTTPAYRHTRWTGGRRGRGLVKVGYTRRDPHTRIREQIGASSPEREPYTLLITARARTRKGQHFTDKEVHAELRRMGVKNVHNEWFEAGPGDVRKALFRVGAKGVRKGTRDPRHDTRGGRPAWWAGVIGRKGKRPPKAAPLLVRVRDGAVAATILGGLLYLVYPDQVSTVAEVTYKTAKNGYQFFLGKTLG